MSLPKQSIIDSPLGKLRIVSNDQAITQIEYAEANAQGFLQPTPLYQKAGEQLRCYFEGQQTPFDLPLEAKGTPFQEQVWALLAAIPYGQTRTYGDLAKTLKTSARAIGNACRRNPITIIIPCHRVIAEQDLGGYSGKREGRFIDIKSWLLHHENPSAPAKIDWTRFRRM